MHACVLTWVSQEKGGREGGRKGKESRRKGRRDEGREKKGGRGRQKVTEEGKT